VTRNKETLIHSLQRIYIIKESSANFDQSAKNAFTYGTGGLEINFWPVKSVTDLPTICHCFRGRDQVGLK